MKTIYILGIIALLFFGCDNQKGYKFWDLSKFKIDTSALAENEEIRLIYTSRGPDLNNESKYYIHLIAVSVKTGDTINILTTAFNAITYEDRDKVFVFISQKKMDDITNKTTPKIDKVARDPRFDDIADNKHPTVFGAIGTMTTNTEAQINQ